MTEAEVTALLGRPDGYAKAGETEALTYSNRRMSGWSNDRGDYSVVLTDGRVTQYGVGTVRPGAQPNTLLIVPLR